MATFTGKSGTANTFIGTAAADLFRFAAADINARDSVTGGGGTDRLQLTSAGILPGTALSGVKGVEQLVLANGTNGIKLINANFTGVTGSKIVVFGGAGNDRIDASTLTGTRAIDVTAGAGLDVLRGGAGADTFRFTAASLAGDTVSGGLGSDVLGITTAGALAAGALARVSGIETFKLAAGGNTIELVSANFSGIAGGKIVIYGGAGNDRITQSGLTAANRIDVTAGAGLDVLRGGAGADAFRFRVADLAGDTISGGGGLDTLVLSSSGTLAASALANVSQVETIQLAEGGNGITLLNANLTGVSDGRITVRGGAAGNDVVNASGLTGARSVDVTAGAGADVLRGGAGNDIFRFKAAHLAGDTVVGGLGTDRLVLNTSGALAAGALAKLSGVELIELAAGGNGLTFINGNFTGARSSRISVTGSAGNDSLDGSAVGAGRSFVITAGAGLDTLKGGAGADTFRFRAADLAGDTVNGGGGADTLQITTAGALAASALAQMSRVETITLAAGGNAITLLNANYDGASYATIDDAKIRIIGSNAADTIDARRLDGSRGSNGIDVTAGGGLDRLLGGASRDVFRFAAQDLNGDTVTGGNAVTSIDKLIITTAGALSAGALANVTGVETIMLAAGGNSIVLQNANLAVQGGSTGYIEVIGGAGNDSVDGSALTGLNSPILITAGAGLDTLKGGEGGDTFRFRASDLAGDTVQGGSGYDTLQLLSGGTLAVDALTNMSGIEEIILAAQGNGLTLTDANIAGPLAEVSDQIVIQSSAGTNLIDAADLTTGRINVADAGGIDTIIGGARTDTLRLIGGNVFRAGDSFDGGGGEDRILFDRSMDFLGSTITNVEELMLFGGASATVTISGENAAQFTTIGSLSGPDSNTQTYTVQLAAGSTTDLSNLTLVNVDAADAIDVVANGGATTVTLSSSITSFTGSADADTVGGAYRSGAVIGGGGGDDRIVHDFGAAIDGGTGNDTLVLLTKLNFVTRVRLMDDNQVVGGSEIIANFENVDASGVTKSGVQLSGRDDVASVLIGSAQGDTITAGAAGAVIAGGLGADILTGVDGAEDRFHISSTAEAAGDTINGAGGDDGIDVLGSADLSGAAISGIETLYLAASDGAGNFTADALTTTVTAAQAQALTDVYGNGYFTDSVETLVVNAGESGVDLTNLNFIYWSGADRVEINGTSGDDTIVGSKSNDVIVSGGGGDRLSGGDGDDVIGYDLYHSRVLAGDAGIDTVRLDSIDFADSPEAVTVNLAAGSITEVYAGSTFTFDATGFENADFSANVLNTTMIGTDGANVLIGGSDADTITGGLGADTLTGGGGADSFVWNGKAEGGDTITDFEQGTDKLVFTSGQFGVVGAFDTAMDADPGANVDLSSADLVYTGERLNSTAEVRSFIDGQNASANHGMFVFALNSADHAILYYSSNASDAPGAVGDTAFYQIADLGTGPFADLSLFMGSFVFV